MLASAAGSLPGVRHLLEKGAEINTRDARGFSPLIIAATRGQTSVVGELLERGADAKTLTAARSAAVLEPRVPICRRGSLPRLSLGNL